ncbi:MAG: hypothetical protein HYZ42_08630, partial [Bacteroidetes bacterium]|nr:hypothetical protein [Bacteroidota bacterium]
MNRPQILAIVICVVLVVFLFFKGLQTSTSDLSNKPESSTPKTSETKYTEESFFENSLKTLSPDISDKLRTLNLDIKKSRNNDQKTDLINKAGSICDSLSLLGLTGYFAEK